jgi:transcription initiation factor TFIIE subunit alpha
MGTPARIDQIGVKREQNASPAWHLKSTISGDLTALGIIESPRTENAVAVLPLSALNDRALRCYNMCLV